MVGHFDKCTEAFMKGVGLCKDSPIAFQNIGRAFFEMTRFDEAIIAFTKSLELDPNNALALYWLGRCYRALEDSSAEMEFYQQALETDPNHVDALFALGTSWATKEAGSIEGLDYLYTDGVYDALLPEHQFYRGLGYGAQGLTDIATQQLRSLHMIDPNLAQRLSTFI